MENRLSQVSVTKDGKTAVIQQNIYNGEGQRTQKIDGNVLATERFQQNATQYYLYNKDIQGSTSSLVKEDGSADAIYQYTDFGETMIQGYDQAKNEVCYTGGIYDQSTGLYYLNARYYDPEDGRFMTEDSYRGEIMNPETGHLYVYCANNPVNYVDPSGHLFGNWDMFGRYWFDKTVFIRYGKGTTEHIARSKKDLNLEII
ncbi:MAG: RHS repeat-associated core domain-containing protein [Anaerostipes hadrus]|uniref:RHS repeat-associated core domain-containing protein n=1 Tax=Anaerostipes hadrus TaxID=649756 RepID=UPI001FA9A176|nr:RHS repeat-associated core domain-containing protein [Anaerostipes hadrus]